MYGQALPLLPKVATPDDLLVLNFGIHHGKEYAQQLREFVAYWEAHRGSLPRLLWQQSAAQHFSNPWGDGQFPGGKPPFQCVRIPHFSVVVSVCMGWQSGGWLALAGGRQAQLLLAARGACACSPPRPPAPPPRPFAVLAAPPRICSTLLCGRKQADGRIEMEKGHSDKHYILKGSWRNALADVAMRKAGIPIVESYNETLPMANMHRDNGEGHECTHFCHPSAPQAWVAALYRTLTEEAEKEKSARAAGAPAAPPAPPQQ